ncbi:hypothetical protein SAMN04487891_101114 [Flagellimonas taeanensis]|uniref:Uncharacterized protein n=1 Tax=Flagellimonas taeanensis TaxID=1005926 RepID=A0A1M6PBL6_9FLAO|nr:YtxH domain-containing protein [Allomuricauda taeanensis]MEE1961201.1 YtxH domain-containing protein [Allomuricauda taeanensis]SFB66544.1 hypothetical protein SAMN04487891_101114 [Allomuricauda taeanensis]SHK05333.1 hypothetical protein SAMN05216293_0115 [Allomuricauda taeanensis]
MRKSINLFLLFIAMAFTMSMNSCRETTEDKAEEAVEDVKDAAEDVGDEVEDAADEVGDEIEDATDDNP